jgi:chemotaxis protein MotB
VELRDISSKEMIVALGDMIKGYLPSIKSMIVAGHTDNVPISTADFNDNLDLSSRQANTVIRTLVEECDINVDIMTGLGFGESQPLDNNDTQEGRIKNRRLEIIISTNATV